MYAYQGVKANKGAAAETVPCMYRHAIAEIMIARNLFENTQKVAEGNFPDGLNGVGSYVLCMISSCIIPQIM